MYSSTIEESELIQIDAEDIGGSLYSSTIEESEPLTGWDSISLAWKYSSTIEESELVIVAGLAAAIGVLIDHRGI